MRYVFNTRIIEYEIFCLCFLAILITKGLRELPGGVAPRDCCCMT